MVAYVTIGAADIEASRAFYDAVLATIGWATKMEFPGWRAYSLDGGKEGPTVWVCTPHDGQPAGAGNGMMVGFGARSREEVHAFHAAAMANGGTDEGGPGPRPQYGPRFYAAYMRDPTGNKLSIVYTGA